MDNVKTSVSTLRTDRVDHDVFISYSRRDKDFVQALNEKLEKIDKDTWVDWSRIPATAKWWEEIEYAIEATNTFVFVISPDSVCSEYCHKEIDHAAKYNKRLVPILRRDLVDEKDAKALHPAMSAHQWIEFRESDDFDSAFQTLVTAINTDLNYARAHTRLLVRAIEWEKKERDESFLLRGSDLEEAEQWITQSASKEPKLIELQGEYITTGRKAETARQKAEIRHQSQRILLCVIAVFSVLAIGTAVYALQQRGEAEAARNLAEQRKEKAEDAQRKEAKQRLIAEAAEKAEAGQRRIAEAAQRAEAKQRNIAEQRRVEAEAARKLAEQRREKAETAQEAEAKQRNIAEQQRGEANRQRGIAVQQRDIAEEKEREANKAKDKLALVSRSRELSAQALAVRDAFPQRSLLMAVESIKTDRTFRITEAGGLLRRLLGEIGGTPLTGHKKPVVAVAFPNERWLATGSKDGTVQLWDKINPATPPIVLQGGTGEIRAIAISPNGQWLAAIGEDTKIQLWDLTASNPATALLLLQGHTEPINTIAFSPDGKWLATAGQDKTVRLWNMTSNFPSSRPILLQAHNSQILQIAFSHSGRWLATGEAQDINVRLWDMTAISPSATPIILKAQPYTDQVIFRLTFSPDEKYLAAAISYVPQVWDLTAKNLSDKPSVILGPAGWISSMTFSTDSRWLVTGSVGAEVKLWDIQSLDSSQPKSPSCKTEPDYSVCRVLVRGHKGSVNAAAFSPDGKWLATASGDNTARLWDMTDPRLPSSILQGHEADISAIAFDAKGQWLATASQDTQARLWKVPDMLNDPIVYDTEDNGVSAVAMSSDGKWIAVASRDNIIRLWSATDPHLPPIKLSGHENEIKRLAFSPNRQWLASASIDGTVRLWDMTNPSAQPHIFVGPSFWSMAFSSSGRWLAAGSYGGIVQVWDMTSTRLPDKPKFDLNTQNGGVRSLAFSPDEHRLVIGGNFGYCDDRGALVWNFENPNAEPMPLRGHCDVVEDVAFSPDNRWVATASWDGKARLWDLTATNPSDRARKIMTFGGRAARIAFSPDGRWLAAGGWDYNIQLQDMNNLNQKPYLLTGHKGNFGAIEFSPNSQWLVTASEDHTIRLWNPLDPTAAPIVLRGHNSGVGSLAFSSDSRWLLSGSSIPGSGDARLWRIQNKDLMDAACRTAGRNLTQQEWQQFLSGQPYHKTCPDLPIPKDVKETNQSSALPRQQEPKKGNLLVSMVEQIKDLWSRLQS